MEPNPTPPSVTRRRFLGAGGAALGLALAGCSSDDDAGPADTTARPAGGDAGATTTTAADGAGPASTGATEDDEAEGGSDDGLSTGTPATTVFVAADFAALGACLVLPEVTAGPFPSPELWERRDIREDAGGLPLRIGIQVVDEACAPVPGAIVELWHCDAGGDYSAYVDGAGAPADDAGPGTTFLRGTQTANADGIVELHSIHPGWYQGRAVHIHARVHLDDATVLTTQLYFPDAENAEVFAAAPYRGDPDTTNAQDAIAGGDPAADGAQFLVSADPDLGGRRGLAVIGIDPTARSAGAGRGGGPGAGGGGPASPGSDGPGDVGPGAGGPGGAPPAPT